MRFAIPDTKVEDCALPVIQFPDLELLLDINQGARILSIRVPVLDSAPQNRVH